MTIQITDFHGKFNFLSNFAIAHVVLGGLTYPTVEHAYQAAKTLDPAKRLGIAQAPGPGAAKRMGRRLAIRPDWEDVKLDIMEELLRQKFHPLSAYGKALKATGEAELIEGNDWGDQLWGCTFNTRTKQWEGQNLLGKMLMKLRDNMQVDKPLGAMQ